MKIVCLLASTALASCAIAPDIRNVPLTEAKLNGSVPTYDFESWLKAHEKKLPARAVIVTMSGGGTRAASFADAVVHELNKIPAPCTDIEMNAPDPARWTCTLARNIIIVSGISGGSMTAGRLAVHGLDGLSNLSTGSAGTPPPNEFEANVLRRSLRWDAVKGFIDPRYWFDRSRKLTDLFSSDFLVGSATYADLIEGWKRPFSPYLILSGTDVLSGRSFVFDQQHMDDICSDLSALPVADGIATASDLPFVFSDVEMRNFRAEGFCTKTNARIDDETARLVQAQQTPYANLPAATEATYRMYFRNSGPRDQVLAAQKNNTTELRRIEYLHLVDGGLSDNLGIRPIVKLLGAEEKNRSGLTNLQALHANGVRDIVFVQVNSRSDSPPARYKKSGSPSFLSLVQQTSFGPIDQVTELSSALAYNSLLLKADRCSGTSGKTPDECLNIPMRLYPIRFDFDLLKSDTEDQRKLQEAVKDISTTQQIDDERLAKLRTVASTLAAQDPCFRTLREPVTPSARAQAVCRLAVVDAAGVPIAPSAPEAIETAP